MTTASLATSVSRRARERWVQAAAAGELHHVIGLLMALSAFFIWFDPRHAPVLVFLNLATAALRVARRMARS